MILDKIKWKIEALFPKKRKKLIQDWDFIMVFENKNSEEITNFFQNLKCKDHVQFQFIFVPEADQLLVLIKIDEEITIQQAHQLKLLKKKEKRSFQLDRKTLNQIIYKAEGQNNLNYANYLRFIRARLQPQNKQILQQERYSVFNKYKKAQFWLNNQGKLFTSQEQLRCKYNFLLTYRQSLQHQTAMQDAYRFPFTQIMKHATFNQLVPIHKNSQFRPIIFSGLKDYIGSNDEVYFEFVSFMQKWLIFPVIIGLMTTFFNIAFEYTADDSPGDFVYALFIMVWSIFFITKWQQSSRWLKLKQQSGYNQLWSEHQNIISKKGFQKRISIITGKQQLFLPVTKKLFNYFISIGSCLTILFLSIVFMVLSLNARGFIEPSHKLIYFEDISKWAAAGGIFDANTWWGQIPNLVHVIVINVFDESFYRPLAKKLTKIQMHLSNKTHSDSIILKYFIYEYIITFADLFYIAFVRFDIEGLRQQLLSLFFIDIVRRLIAQTLIPWLRNKHLSYSLKGSLTKKVAKQQELRHYAIMEPFDDYLEIITNLGYLVMISSCFPLAPFLIIIAHGVELLQDKYKMVHIFKRKLPQKFVGMGYWKDIIVFICFTSIVTNILLFAFSSQQIVSIFPKLYESGKDLVLGNTDLNQIFGGAASSILTAMITIGNQTLQSIPQNPLNFIFNLASNQTNSTLQGNSSLLFNVFNQTQTTINPFVQQMDPVLPFSANTPINSGGMTLTQFHPPPPQHEVTFIVILFLLEHIFLIIFIFLRKIVSKRKCLADIFLERKQYKRKIKKFLAKDILASSIRDEAVNKILISSLSGTKESDDPLSILTSALSKSTSSSSTQSINENNEQSQKNIDNARPVSLIDQVIRQIIQKNVSKEKQEDIQIKCQKQNSLNESKQKKQN